MSQPWVGRLFPREFTREEYHEAFRRSLSEDERRVNRVRMKARFILEPILGPLRVSMYGPLRPETGSYVTLTNDAESFFIIIGNFKDITDTITYMVVGSLDELDQLKPKYTWNLGEFMTTVKLSPEQIEALAQLDASIV